MVAHELVGRCGGYFFLNEIVIRNRINEIIKQPRLNISKEYEFVRVPTRKARMPRTAKIPIAVKDVIKTSNMK